MTPKNRFIALIAFLSLIYLLAVSYYIFDEKSPHKGKQSEKMAIVDGNSLTAISPVYYPSVSTYGSLMKDIVMCESGGKHDTWGDKDYKYPAYGIAQFQRRTFYWLAGLMGKDLNWKSRTDQLRVLNWALKNGYGKYWSCF